MLKVISSSPGEWSRFSSDAGKCRHVCGAKFGNLWLRERCLPHRLLSCMARLKPMSNFCDSAQYSRSDPESGSRDMVASEEAFQVPAIAGGLYRKRP